MVLGFPFRMDNTGRIAYAEDGESLRALIEQVLFTAPGERPNRIDFGTPLMQLPFAAPNTEVISGVQFLVESALQQWLGDLIDVEAVQIDALPDGVLQVVVHYRARKTLERRSDAFEYRT